MAICRKHPDYQGRRVPKESNGTESCKRCTGIFAASVAMRSKLVYDCIEFALHEGLNTKHFEEELAGYRAKLYQLENEYA